MNNPHSLKWFLTRQVHAKPRRLPAVAAPLVLALALAQLALAQDPTITLQPTNQTAELDDNVLFTCRATTTNGPLSVQWQRNDPTAPVIFTNIPNAKRLLFSLNGVTREHAGDYRAIIANAAGDSVTSQVARLEVIVPQFTRITQGSLVSDNADDSAAAWGDYDGDGDMDVTTSGGYWAPDSDWSGIRLTVPHANQGDGTFAVASPNSFANVVHGFGITWADADNDGDLDAWLGVLETRAPVFLLNLGDWRFERIFAEPDWIVNGATVRGSLQAWGDYDGDGWVDLAIASAGYATADPWPTMVLRNTGDTRFAAANLGLTRADSISWVDLDEDGDLDLFCMSGSLIAFLRNENGELVRMLSGEAPFADAGYLDAWGDFDNDGDLDVLITKAPGNPNLWRNEVSGFWSIVEEPSLQAVRTGFGSAAAWGDYDNDGNLDLFIIPAGDETQLHRNRLFRNKGAAGFVEVLEGKPVTDEASGTNWSCAHCFWVDYDNDGDLDLYVLVSGWTHNSNLLYRNNGNANHWIEVTLSGRISNRSAIGAKVRVKAVIGGSEVWQLRVISAQAWTQELVAHFGLGDAAKIDTVRIEWPSGIVQELKDVAVNQHLEVVETQGVTPGPMSFEAFGRDSQGVFQATVNCPVEGVLCVMEASSDFERWSMVQVRTNVTGTVEFTDTQAADLPTRYYRVLVP